MAWQFINQLDGSENQRNNCVPACVNMLLLNKAHVHVTTDQLKDSVYGTGYLGGQAASKYVGVCASHGVVLAPFNGQSTALVDEMAKALDAGKAVMFTIPTNWAANVDSGSTHVMIAYARSGNDFSIADPWGGVARTWSRDYMTPRLRYNQIWEGTAPMSSDLAAAGWHDTGNFDPANYDAVLTGPNGLAVVKGFRRFVLQNDWVGYNWPLNTEYTSDSIEPGNPAIGAGTRQDFRLGSLGYTTAKNVYQIWIGQDYLAQQKVIAAKDARITAAQKALGG